MTDDLFSDISDVQLMQLLLTELHDDLTDRIQRLRYLTDLSGAFGQTGTMIFGGTPAYAAFAEARSSFVNGNFVATILLSQSLTENLLAAFLQTDLNADPLPTRVNFPDTLERCRSHGFLSEADHADLKRLSTLRNPLSHFRSLDDAHHIDRRAIDARTSSAEVLRNDAYFAIGVAVRMLAKPPFRIGG